jgi:Zn-dependent protease
MTDLLLILFTIALLVLTHLLSTLLAIRLPSRLKIKPTHLKHPPSIMADLFEQADQALTELGFSQGHWAIVHTTPKLPGFTPPMMRIYHHKREPIVAQVSPPHSVFATDRCHVVFLSISKKKTFLTTANRALELFPRPPEKLSIIQNTQFDTLAEQFRAHQEEMSRKSLSWLDRSHKKGELAWSFYLIYRYEKKRFQWISDEGYIRQLDDGSAVPRLSVALRFLWRLLTRREKNPPHEDSPLPSGRAAYLFQNWRRSQQFPSPVSSQLGLFAVSALAFVLLTGLFWNWGIALLLVAVIGFHEAGHWIAMRILGYRNLQILMLPLVGGVTMGQETEFRASHRILISLMGPLPGIILGTVLIAFFGAREGWISELGVVLLAVNYINLLPIMPLDGGQILKALIPTRRFGLLISLDWLGSVTLLLLGWLTDSLFLAALALIPLFSGLALTKRKKIFDALEGVAGDTNGLSSNEQIASVIQAIDQRNKAYRPLGKKAAEITEILNTLRLKPAASSVAVTFLVIYIATFLLPPIAVFSTSSGIQSITARLYYNPETIRQNALDRALALPMSQLVSELAKAQSQIPGISLRQGEANVLMPPATNEVLNRAEARLGTGLGEQHRQFLEASNGFINLLNDPQETGYLLFPAERIERFGQQLPRIVSRLSDKTRTKAPMLIHMMASSSTTETETEELNLNQIAHMLYVGSPHNREYLLLDTTPRTDSPTQLLVVYESPSGLTGKRFKSLRHFLADDLSTLQLISLDLELPQ